MLNTSDAPPSAQPYVFLVVDDQDVLRTAVREWLVFMFPGCVVIEAQTGEAAVEYSARHRPTVILMDIDLPVMTGIEATRQIKQVAPQSQIIMLTVYDDLAYRKDSFAAGASAYVPKHAIDNSLAQTIRATLEMPELGTSLSVLNALSAHAAVLDATGMIVAVNTAWEDFARENGAVDPASTGVGTNYLDVCHAAARAQSAGAAEVGLGIRAVLAGEQDHFTWEHPCHAPHEQRWFRLRVTPLDRERRHILVQHENVTSTRQAHEARTWLAAIVDSSDDAIVIKTLDGTILTWNAGAERMYGYSAAQVVGQPMMRLVPDDRREEEVQMMARIGRGERITHYESVRVHRDGQRIDVSLSIAPTYDAQGALLGASSIARDITERKRAERALQRQITFSRLLQDVAVAANEAVSLENALQTVIDLICNVIGWPLGHVYLVSEEDPARLLSTAIWHVDDPAAFTMFRALTKVLSDAPALSLPAEVMLQRKPIWTADVSVLSTAMTQLIQDMGVRASFAFPVWLGTEIVAVLEFFAGEPIEPDQALLEVLANVGTQLGRVVERARADQALRTSAAHYQLSATRLRAVWESANDAMSLSDPDGIVLDANPAYVQLYGYGLDQVIGHPFSIIFPEEQRASALELYRTAFHAAEASLQVETIVRRADGVERWVESSANIILQDGQRTSLLSVIRDITERKRLEAALLEERALLVHRIEERTADLSAANAQLSRAARLKDEFLSSMSHELRTPLNAILGLSEALQEQVYGVLNDRQRHALQGIQESGRHLLELINDILDLAKIGADKLELVLEPVPTVAICQASLRMIRQAAHTKRITVESSLDGAPKRVHADARRLKQILVNLLSNAIKFTPEGGTIGLVVEHDEGANRVTFSVWDTGIGIAPEHIEQLFQPFVQIDSRLARQYEGTGLGLTLVSRMVDLHGGKITVSSTVNTGSRFTIALPWHAPEERGQAKDPLEPGRAVPPTQPIRTVLLIEDSPTASEQVRRYLGELGIAVETISTGGPAVVRAAEQQPDLILLDILLPDVSGWDVLAQLQADQRTCAFPVVIVSVVDERTYGLELGATAYLAKPYSRSDLHRLIEQFAGREAPNIRAHTAPDRLAAPVILLAEDNQLSITMITDYLSSLNYRVSIARNGAEAVARAHEVHPALILMDIQMPNIDGLEAIRRIRSDDALRSIPIIALTALAMPGDYEMCIAAGANDYLSKPMSLSRLAETIATYLDPSTLPARTTP